jgi:hypothetical protein
VVDLVSVLFAPSFPEIEQEIHEGRKRIDVLYTNVAREGFFAHVRDNYVAAYIPVECKNYSGDPANPELDQLAGRFSNLRGWVGILCCRKLEDRHLFTQRCRDTAHDDRGFIIALDDDDLARLVHDYSADSSEEKEAPFRTRLRELVS